MTGKAERLLVLIGLIIGAVSFQLEWRPGEFAGLILAAVAAGVVIARSAS